MNMGQQVIFQQPINGTLTQNFIKVKLLLSNYKADNHLNILLNIRRS
jgi:hypothetical protein